MNIKINLTEDFSNLIKEKVKEFEIRLQDLNYYNELKAEKKIDDVCLKFFNLNRRFIQQKVRRIEKSKEFICPAQFQKNLNKLEERIKNGEDLTPFLSRFIFKLDFRDALLNDWGVHHLHLGELKDPKKLSEGHNEVLYAYFTDTTAYFIQIMTHKDWYQPETINTLHNNWPDLIKSYKLDSSIKGESDEVKIRKWRQGGVSTAISTPDGTTYMGTGGSIVLSLHNIQDKNLCNVLINRLESFEKIMKEDIEDISKFIKNERKQEFTELIFKLYSIDILNDNIIIFIQEQLSGLIILSDNYGIRRFF